MSIITKENVRMDCPFTITFWATTDPPCCAVFLSIVEWDSVVCSFLQIPRVQNYFDITRFSYGQYLAYYSYTPNSL